MAETNENESAAINAEDQITTIADLKAQLEKVNERNRMLIAEKQKAKAKAQEALDAADEAAQQAAERTGDIEALKAAHGKELAKLKAERDSLMADLRTIRVDNEISRALREGNTIADYDEPLTYMFKAKADFSNGEASIEGKPVYEFISDYLGTSAGQKYVRAAENTGGGATGNSTTVAQTKLTKRPSTPAEFDVLDAMPVSERNAFLDSIGAPDLKV
jgi:chromosome segregation ATPase